MKHKKWIFKNKQNIIGVSGRYERMVGTERILKEKMVKNCPNVMKTVPTDLRNSNNSKPKKLYQVMS